MSMLRRKKEMIKILFMLVCLFVFIFIVLLAIYLVVKVKEKNGDKTTNKPIENSSKSSVSQNYNVKSVFNFMDFENIEDNMIIQKKDKKYLMVIECQGINYDLMSEIEQTSVESGFMQFLNTLTDSIQIYIQTRTINLERSIVNYKDRIKNIETELLQKEAQYNQMLKSNGYTEKEINDKRFEVVRQRNLYEYGKDIVKNTENMSLNKNILRKKYFIIVTYYYSPIDGEAGLLSSSEVKDVAFSELYTRCQSMIRALGSTGVLGKVLDSYELVDLLYNAYNRDESETYGVDKAISAEYDQLYVQTQDILDKKMRAIEDQVERKALDRAEDAVNYARSEKEKEVLQKERTIEDLIDDLAKELIKSNEQYLGEDITEKAMNKIDDDKKGKEEKKNARQKENSKRKVGNK